MIENSTARVNVGTGIGVGSGSVARGCAAFDNADGFTVSAGARVEGCSATANRESGFVLFGGAHATDCNARESGLHGFSFSSNCLVARNLSTSSGLTGVGAAFHSTGNDSRVERNAARGGDYGYWITGTRNLLLGNSAAGTITAWQLDADNLYGVIVDRSAVGTAAVSGSAAPSVLATTDPHANFTH